MAASYAVHDVLDLVFTPYAAFTLSGILVNPYFISFSHFLLVDFLCCAYIMESDSLIQNNLSINQSINQFYWSNPFALDISTKVIKTTN